MRVGGRAASRVWRRIVVFNFYPLPPEMIVMLALLNDGAIIGISPQHGTSAWC